MPEVHDALRRASRDLDLATDDLWLRCFALGGMRTPAEIAGFLGGALAASDHERELLAVAVNECLRDSEAGYTVPYLSDTR